MLRDVVAQDQIAALLLEPEDFPPDVRVVVDWTDDNVVLHDLRELTGALGDVRVTDDGNLAGVALRVAQGAEHIVNGRGDLDDGRAGEAREHARCAAARDDHIVRGGGDAAQRVLPVTQVADPCDQLDLRPLRSKLLHDALQTGVGDNAQNTDRIHTSPPYVQKQNISYLEYRYLYRKSSSIEKCFKTKQFF